jgi:protease-4
MKGFFKYFLASFLAVCVALLLLTVIGLGSVSALMSAAPDEVKLKPNTVLVLDLGHPIGERTIDSPFEAYDFQTMQSSTTLGIYDILTNIDKAARDENIKGILLKTGLMSPGIATLDELRQALAEFKKSGKFIYAYSETYTQGDYYVASLADKVFLNPAGLLEFRGLRSETIFFKKALEKFGVDVQVIREGKYKSAVEPFLLESMSEASKEQTNAYMQTVWNRVLAGISESRSMPVAQLNLLADNWTARTSKGALESKLVDSLLYEDQVMDLVKKKSGIEGSEKIRTVDMKDYLLVTDPGTREYTPDRIAIIYGNGSIGMESSGNQSIGTQLAASFAKARKDNKIKAIVFRVNSPGGSALASEVIRREVELAAKAKPLIVSMGNVAGSGGYWIATPGRKIVAGTTSLTGSIGAFGLVPNMEKLLSDKIGITFDGIQTNKLAGTGSIFRPMTPEEKGVFEEQLGQTYGQFLEIVAASRKMTVSQVDSIGQGRIWSGEDALKVGLIDETGGLKKAIEMAAAEAGLKTWRIRELPALRNPINEIISQFTGQKQPAESILLKQIPALADLQDLINGGNIQARIPFRIDIH